MADQKNIYSWVRIKQTDSKMTDLRCMKDSKDRVVKVYGWNGEELPHNAESKSVFYNGQYWWY